MDCETKLMLAEHMLKWAESLINDAISIMSPRQVSEWGGVRAWQELLPWDEEGYLLLDRALTRDVRGNRDEPGS